MTNLSPINSSATGRVTAVDARPEVADTRRPARPGRDGDRVEVSDQARFLAKLNAMPEVRSELVERIRSEIADGTYDSDEKLDLAIDAMIDESF